MPDTQNMGRGDEYAAVLVHVDVVPEGDGWTYPPYDGIIHNGRIYGRGACDNKGPAVAALYCLKVLKDANVTGKRRMRVIFGADEERGMQDMPHYFENEPYPVMAFTPDAEYPIYNREKGLLHMDVFLKGLEQDSPFRSIVGGLAPNVVPDKCTAIVKSGAVLLSELLESAKQFASDKISIKEMENGDFSITSVGTTAHASRVSMGFNACQHLVKFLCFAMGEKAPNQLRYIDECAGSEYDGKSFGVKCSDELSGELTLNIGILDLREDSGKMSIDIRYPVSQKGEELYGIIAKKTENFGYEAVIDMHKDPLYIPQDAPLIQKLSKAYESATGQKAELKAQGGATYARTLDNVGVCLRGGIRGW